MRFIIGYMMHGTIENVPKATLQHSKSTHVKTFSNQVKTVACNVQLVGWLVCNSTFSTIRLYRAMRKLKVC